MFLTLLLTLAVFAVEKTITLTDYSGRGFAPDLVHYGITLAPGQAKTLHLYGPEGAALPLQLSTPDKQGKAALSFVGEIPPNGTMTYTLRNEKLPPAGSRVTVRTENGMLVLDNGLYGIKVPKAEKRVLKTPVAATSLPAPLLAFRTNNGPWLGAGTMRASRLVSGYQMQVLATGPVYAEVQYALTFANSGYYRATIRVIDRVPLAMVREEYDLKEQNTSDCWELNLTQGWQPDSVESMNAMGNGGYNANQGTLDALVKSVQPGVNNMPVPGAPAENPVRVIEPDSCWGGRYISYIGLWNAAALKADPSATIAGVVPLHKGDWRRTNGLPLYSTGTDARVCFPLGVRQASWLEEPTSETSPFSCQEHEPGLSATYGRRVWGLQLGAPALAVNGQHGKGVFYYARALYGIVGLDRYKDYVLQWSDTKPAYPRVFIRQQNLAQYKQAMENSPVATGLKKVYCLTGDAKLAAKNAQTLKGQLVGITNYMLTTPAMGHHHSYTWIAALADDVLSWPDLPAEERAMIRARLALITYLHVDPDMMSHGTGTHTGNPNMGVSRQMDMSNFMALLPDHPAFSAWRDYMADFTAYKLGCFTAPGGGWFEFGSAYHMHGFAKATRGVNGLMAAGATNAEQLYQYLRPDWEYYMNLLTPYESRWRARVIPGSANSPTGYSENFLEAMGDMADRDPEFAANLAWAWQENGANDRDFNEAFNPVMSRPWIAPKEPKLGSTIVPGIGVIFRAHQGPDETYMYFRSGYNWSHWYEDQGHFLLMSRGATLVPFQPYQYWWSPKTDFDLYNCIRFGNPENKFPFSWPDSNILDHAFGPTVDYAWSSSGFPEWYIAPGSSTGFGGARKLADGMAQQEGAFHWNRQVLFLKGERADSPNYFVLRDTMPGGKLASWLSLNLLGTRANVQPQADRLAVNTEWPVKLDVLFAQGEPKKAEFYEENQYLSLGGWSGPTWWRSELKSPGISKNWVLKDGTPAPEPTRLYDNPGYYEKRVIVRIPGAPGEGYTWLLYPRKAEEPAPVVSRLAPGVLKIVTPESTDYVFLSPAPITFTADGVTFSGCAGAVRLKAVTVTLALTGGPGRVGYRGYMLDAVKPVEETVKLTDLKAGVRQIDAASTIKAPTEPAPGTTLFSVDSNTPMTETKDAMRIEARKATIVSDGKTIRFIAPERSFAELSAGNVGVRGMGPFDLTFTADGITGRVDGDTRTLVVTWPEKILRPMFHLDGVRWYAGWADDSCIAKGRPTPQYAIAFGVTQGPHTVAIGEWTYPALPPTPAPLAIP
jgi:hypothetical protein